MITEEQKVNNRQAFEALFAFAAKKRDYSIALTSDFMVKAPTPVTGEWYAVAPCDCCGKLAPLFADASKGEVGFPAEDHFIAIDCHYCGSETKAYPTQITSIEWH